VVWARQSHADSAIGHDIAVGTNHDIFLTGLFSGTAVLPNDVPGQDDIVLTSTGESLDAFVAILGFGWVKLGLRPRPRDF
jgi:hypothetical protein